MDNNNNKKVIKEATILDALIPIVILICLLFSSVYWYGSDSSFGPNQIALIFAMFIASMIGIKNGYTWKEIEKGIVSGISLSLGAILILLAVGALIGSWMLSGTVPTLIYYGLELLNPSLFYAATCLICSVVAMSIGSSWTTAATVGVALMGVANGMGMSEAVTAGAVVSGAYFGDKISPLSETTNLAPAIAGTNLFEHIQYMLWTVVPSIIITLIIFTVLGFNSSQEASAQGIVDMQNLLESEFNLGLHLLIPLAVLLVLALKKVPAFPAVSIGAILGGIWAAAFQPEVVQSFATDEREGIVASITVVWTALYAGVNFSTDSDVLNDLLSRGGMSSMLNTIWLIMCALTFGAVLEKVGLLKRIVSAILKGATSAGDMISRTILTCFATNVITADQYMAIVMPGRMYKNEYEKRGLHQLNLSRSLEDGGTLTSPLIPWNTCGAYMGGVLGVGALDYAIYAFFNLINPILAIVYAYLGIKILRVPIPAYAEPVASKS
ncbi:MULTISPECIES: Na+/H+ antiporter NhaC [Alteromonadaceae]|uniref:Na+/H+ antiporter NhaC n=1 Tax=Alteromonadaceae TaxID=72275 RepID=UPI001C0A1FA0|nr:MULTISPECIES: Na+/H+ antiporter NhaC [Aliiglaciecola]MBU2876298.1 Na+/H+ antiporter NhaC [Aliiglaciecola lipolytica]MDO6710514.1 Na+/H+ antiporter NhaC [Aliiglaciecola sp. 2_MG-2023]MDO6751621.1 Na+/H+ antiporter NhaC [Aliiglaciecola sp. 1_MG-2023]